MTRAGRLIAASLLCATALAGCSGTVADNLGMGKRAPDEFQVVRRAPLVLPPDYNLRPPEPGAAPSSQQDVAAQAQEILTGQSRATPSSSRQSSGEVALLEPCAGEPEHPRRAGRRESGPHEPRRGPFPVYLELPAPQHAAA